MRKARLTGAAETIDEFRYASSKMLTAYYIGTCLAAHRLAKNSECNSTSPPPRSVSVSCSGRAEATSSSEGIHG